MSVNILLKRSATASKRPVGASMAFGELNLNYDAATGGLYYKNSTGGVVKVGPCQVSATAPNASPAGSAGNSAGEFWFDSSTGTLKVYDGTTWQETGGAVQGVTGTAPVSVDNTDPLNPVISVDAASTAAPGVVQLNDTTASTSTTEALTANQGRNLQQQIDALIVSSNLTFAGTLDASTGDLVTVTNEGIAQGFAIGDPLPSPAAGNSEFFVIATVGSASYTPPGGSATEVHVGDWFLSDGTVWQFLDVGFQAAYASTTSPGIVQLATDAEVQAGVETEHAVVSSSLQSKLSDSVSTVSSTTIASSTAAKDAYDAGVQGQTDAAAAQATADQAVIDAAAAQATADAAVPDTSFTAAGDLLVGSGAGTYAALPAGAADYILSSNGIGGLTWVPQSEGDVTGVTGTAPITVDNTDPQNPAIGVNAASTTASGVVQLNDTVTSTSDTEAATANAAKTAYDAGMAAMAAFEAFQYAQVLNVAKSGDDTTGNGGQHKPYATISKALSMITDASPTKRYVIQVGAGAYTETTLSLKANVFIVGDQKEAVRITATTYNLASDFSGNADNRSGMANVILTGACSFDWNAVTSQAGKLYFTQVSFVSAVTLNGYNNAIAQGMWESCLFYSTLTISGINVVKFSDNSCFGNVTLNQHPNGGMPTILNATGGQCNGTVTLTTTVNDFNRRCAMFAKNFYCEYITIDGPSSYADANIGSMPRSRDRVTISNGGNFVPITATSPVVTNTVQSGEPGYQNYSYLGYVHGSTNTDLYVLTMGGDYNPASTGYSVFVEADAYGLTANTNGGDVNLTTAAVSGTGVRGKIKLDGREVDVDSTKIVNLADGTATNDAVNFGQLSAVSGVADAAIPDSAYTAPGDLLVGTGAGAYTALASGPADYILASDGVGGLSWVPQSEGDVTGVTGTGPITVDNTDPQNPVIGIDAASTTTSGAVQLNDTVTSTSTSEAATANAAKTAYDKGAEALTFAQTLGITSDTVIYVNTTDGDDLTGTRGTTKAFKTITAALAAASENDTVYLSPGTFIENVTLTKGVNLVGTMNDQALGAGTKIQGNFVVNATASMTKNWAISHVYFISTNSTPPFSITANSFGAGGTASVWKCDFTQQTSSDPTQYAVTTSGTWARSVYFRDCLFDGNFHHNAGTAAGASGYAVIDRLLGSGNSGFYHRVTTGTVEFRNPSNSLAPIFQTGGVALVNGATSGITPSAAGLNTVFGTTGFSYKGSAASVGTGTVYFQAQTQGTGKIDIGANLIYGYTDLIMDPANLTVSGSSVAYTTAVPAAANAQTMSQQRPRFDLLTATSSVAAANQLATVVDSSTGAVYTVSAMDAGTF